MEMWNLFPPTSYTFLELEPGSGGNRVINETTTTGILKERDGMVQSQGAEAHEAQTTLHMRPDESFISAVGGHQKLVGHGIRADGVEYRIQGAVPGRDFETGTDAFYLCTLERSQTWVSALPLE